MELEFNVNEFCYGITSFGHEEECSLDYYW